MKWRAYTLILGKGASIHSKISHLLSLSLYRQALVLLFDLYINKTPTKLGSLQRWVRECDATSRPGRELSPEEEEERNIVLKCLDMVLRVCGGGEQSISDRLVEDLEEKDGKRGVVRRMKVWNVRNELDASGERKLQEEVPLWNLIQEGFEGESGHSFSSDFRLPYPYSRRKIDRSLLLRRPNDSWTPSSSTQRLRLDGIRFHDTFTYSLPRLRPSILCRRPSGDSIPQDARQHS